MHVRLSAEAERQRIAAKQREDAIKQKELEECTFAPQVRKNPLIQAPTRKETDVFKRLASTPTASNKSSLSSRSKDSSDIPTGNSAEKTLPPKRRAASPQPTHKKSLSGSSAPSPLSSSTPSFAASSSLKKPNGSIGGHASKIPSPSSASQRNNASANAAQGSSEQAVPGLSSNTNSAKDLSKNNVKDSAVEQQFPSFTANANANPIATQESTESNGNELKTKINPNISALILEETLGSEKPATTEANTEIDDKRRLSLSAAFLAGL